MGQAAACCWVTVPGKRAVGLQQAGYLKPSLWSDTLTTFTEQLQHGGQPTACQELSAVLYSLATAASANEEEVPGIEKEDVEAAACLLVERVRLYVTHPLLEGVTPQAVSNTLWGCAKLRINPGDAALNSLLQAMARPALLEAAGPQALANTLWATSELQQECSWRPQVQQRVWQRLLDQQHLRRFADKSLPLDIAEFCVAMARLAAQAAGAAAPGSAGSTPAISQEMAQQCLLTLLQGKVAQRLDGWKPREICNCMYACAKLAVPLIDFFEAAAAASSAWLPKANVAGCKQAAWACGVLKMKQQQQLMAGLVHRSKQLLGQQGGRRQLASSQGVGLAAVLSHAVAVLDMQHLAGDAKALVAGSTVMSDSRARKADLALLWDVHAWLLQHQLLDGKGLAGLLSEQQLADGRAAAEAR